ncbi:MAG TPA: SDR family oxidoreductase [Bryobacteraceae bacterium]|nr:SDR family oxidoreductase [Bryobacteraceae bacterium]
MAHASYQFKDKNVLITGGGRGIGKRLAIGFAQAGARIGLVARSKPELDLTHLEIEHNGGNALRIRADVSDLEQMCAAVDRMRVQLGGVDILICSAGVQGPIGRFIDNSPRQWLETIHTNVIGVANSVRAALPEMIERRRGKIIVLAGRGVAKPRPYFSSYATSKAALARFVETIAIELQEHNVQVNCMSPGGAYTHMTDEILRAGERAGAEELEGAQQVRLTGGVAPEKQIELALFLASEESNHISGRIIHVNDDWKRLKRANIDADLYTLRRVTRI